MSNKYYTTKGSALFVLDQGRWGADGSGGTATATLGTSPNDDQVDSISVTGGAGYTTPPKVTIDPPSSGTTATAHAVLADDGTIDSIVVDDPGSGYASAPSVTISSKPGIWTFECLTSMDPGSPTANTVDIDVWCSGGLTLKKKTGFEAGEASVAMYPQPELDRDKRFFDLSKSLDADGPEVTF